MEKDSCLKCHTVLEDLAQECPQCRAHIVYCSSCGRAINSEVKKCPFCNEVNLEYTGPAQARPAEAAPDKAAGKAGEVTAVESSLRLQPQLPALEPGLLTEPSLRDFAGGAGLLSGTLGGGLDVLAPLNDILGESGAAAGDAPFVIEINEGLRFEPHNHGAVQMRWRPRALPPKSTVTISLKGGPALGLQAQEPITLETKTTAETRILDSWSCRPTAAGNIPFQVVVEAFSAAGEPIGRWQGSHVAQVGRIESIKEVHIGGDLVDISSGGGGGIAEMLGMGGMSNRQKWVTIPCYPEPNYQARLGRAVPGWKMEPPAVQNGMEAGPAVAEFALRLQGQGQLGGLKARIVWATQAVLGREPSPGEPPSGADFQIGGDSGRKEDRQRVSGRHFILRLHGGRAWLQDVSRNGTWLNGGKLVRERWHLLVHGDLLSLSQYKAANFKVYLQASAGGVTALCLAQHTASGIACVALATRCLFWPAAGVAAWQEGAREGEGLWLAEQTVPGGRRFLARATNESGWISLEARTRPMEKLGWQMSL